MKNPKDPNNPMSERDIEDAVDRMIKAAEPQPQMPKLRTFRVYSEKAKDEYVDAHSVHITDGALLFQVGAIIDGYVVNLCRRGFGPGTWSGFEEVFVGQAGELKN